MASQTNGIIFAVIGAGCVLFGALISLTGIGLLCGIPMIIAGIPLMMFGGIQIRQGTIQAGVRDGLRQGLQPPANPQWQPPPSVVQQPPQPPPVDQPGARCRTCGAPNNWGNRFCSQCAAPLIGDWRPPEA
jgi:hypothetical protein